MNEAQPSLIDLDWKAKLLLFWIAGPAARAKGTGRLMSLVCLHIKRLIMMILDYLVGATGATPSGWLPFVDGLQA